MSVETSQDEVQTAMYSLLMPGGALDSMLAGYGLLAVYDFAGVPQNAAFDYLTVGDGYEMPYDTFGENGTADGFYYFSTLHIWSTQRGTKNPSLMVARLNALFHRQPLALATLNHVYTRRNMTKWLADPSGVIPVLHIALQYKIYSTQ